MIAGFVQEGILDMLQTQIWMLVIVVHRALVRQILGKKIGVELGKIQIVLLGMMQVHALIWMNIVEHVLELMNVYQN